MPDKEYHSDDQSQEFDKFVEEECRKKRYIENGKKIDALLKDEKYNKNCQLFDNFLGKHEIAFRQIGTTKEMFNAKGQLVARCPWNMNKGYTIDIS